MAKLTNEQITLKIQALIDATGNYRQLVQLTCNDGLEHGYDHGDPHYLQQIRNALVEHCKKLLPVKAFDKWITNFSFFVVAKDGTISKDKDGMSRQEFGEALKVAKITPFWDFKETPVAKPYSAQDVLDAATKAVKKFENTKAWTPENALAEHMLNVLKREVRIRGNTALIEVVAETTTDDTTDEAASANVA